MSNKENLPPTTVVGIDLGTTFCAIAHASEDGVASTIVNREGELTTPSAVWIESEEIVVGKQAVKAQTTVPENVAAFAKRDVGKASYSKRVDGKTFAPEQIQSLILRQLKEDAEAKLGQKVVGAVITVPAYFNEPKRRSTIQSAKLAGLETLAIINEPTAAAIAYGLEKHAQIMGAQTVLVYDLGGGTFDASLVKVDGTDIKVIATDGNAMLGGMDWDRCLAKWLDDQFHDKHDFRPSETARGPAWLMQEAAELKHALTSRKEVKVRLSFQAFDLKGTVDQQTFDDLTAHLLDRTRFTASKLLKEANLRWRDVDQVILVGGSTRMPQVARMLTKLSEIDPNMSVSADEAIAHGAALLARSLNGESRQQKKDAASIPLLNVTDVNAHHLGVLGVDLESKLPRNHVMIPRNTSLPATQTTRFQTVRKNQTRVVVEVVEGGDPRGRYGTHIGRCILGGLPDDLPAGSSVDVTFSYDRDGLIRVAARLPSTGQTAEIHIERNSVNLPSESVSDLSAEWSIDN